MSRIAWAALVSIGLLAMPALAEAEEKAPAKTGETVAKAEKAGAKVDEKAKMIADLSKAIDDATAAVKADKKDEALAALKTARELADKLAGPKTVKVVNTVCPIMGNKLNPNGVPVELTREFKGQKIGFCCSACPPAWDKLSDADKQKKLDEKMKSSAPMEHMKH